MAGVRSDSALPRFVVHSGREPAGGRAYESHYVGAAFILREVEGLSMTDYAGAY